MKKIEDIDFLQFVSTQESQFFVGFADSRDEIHERFESGVRVYGDTMPWQKTHDSFRFRPGEVTLWAGINGHGKSMVTSHVAAHLANQSPVTIASLEMPIPATAHRMIRQISGTGNPTKAFIDKVLHWTDNKIWVYDQLDTVQSERILGMIIYAASELGCGHIFVDSLMKCGVGQDDYDRQARFVDRLCWAAKTHKTHIHLIHHMRKGEREEEVPGKFDVKGSGAIVDMVDNLAIVHRNKKKEMLIAAGEQVSEYDPDTTVRIAKQRHGEWEGDIKLWFHKDSQQFISGQSARLQWFNVDQAKGAMNG